MISSVVLIDDDFLMHISHKYYYERRNIPVFPFFTVDEFIKNSSSMSKDTIIIIDSHLGNGIKGELESKRIFDLGFQSIYLSTGYDKNSISRPSWIKDIFSKNPADYKI